MTPAAIRRIIPGLAVAAVAGFAAADACAQDASPWIRDAYSSVRLIAGSRSGSAFLGGIAFQLQPGWKTYWRTPGDSGVPPRLDFARSDNIESVTVLWPAPTKFADGAGGVSLGYQKQVVLPLRIVARNPDKPVTLRASIDYAVCEKLCVPVTAKAELAFASVASTEDTTIAAALDAVPKPARVGEPAPVAVRDIKRDGGNGVVVDVVAPDNKTVDLFVEGPTEDWALPVPKLIGSGAGGVRQFGFDLDGVPAGARADGAALKLTVVAGTDTAYEFNAILK